MSLISSVFDPIELFAPFSVQMRRLLKSICTENGQHLDNKVEPGDAKELKWKEQLTLVAQTNIDRRYFIRERERERRDKTELLVFTDAST